MVRRRYAITLFELLHTVSYRGYLPANLVTEYQRSPVKAVPFHDVTAAYAACFDTDKQFTGTNRWNGSFFYSHISIAVPDCCSNLINSSINKDYFFLFLVAFLDFSLSSIC